ncbi:MAG: AAA family ATPase [Thermoplasmata archaeon]|nr:AAA family ATPase [Thermoplasmata archaeon]
MKSNLVPSDDRILTYIDGFDNKIGGGIRKGHVVLLAGTPGTMKSSIALNLLYNNIKKRATNVLYISIEESKDSLLECMQRLGFGTVDENKFFIVDIGKLRLEHTDADIGRDWFKILKEYLRKKVENEGVEIVVVDSLTAVYALTTIQSPRQELFHFFGFLKRLGVTTILISETQHNGSVFGPFHEDYLADGTILLKFVDVGESDVQLRIRAVKMRHSKIHHGYQTLIFRDGQFMATPPIAE